MNEEQSEELILVLKEINLNLNRLVEKQINFKTNMDLVSLYIKKEMLRNKKESVLK